MSNNSSTISPTGSPPASPTTSVPPSSSADPNPTTASTPDTTPPVTSSTPTTLPTTSTPGSTSSTPATSTTSSTTTSSSSSTPSSTTIESTSHGSTSTFVTTVTSEFTTIPTSSESSTASASTSSGAAITPGEGSNGGLGNSGKIAIAVVVPIAAVALLILAGIYLWRKRKQRKDAEEQRRKEVEDYGYNPNADPTIPAVGAGAIGAYEMKEDASGYRGWGSTTLAGSTGRKASTTMSGGGGVAYSDATSPTRGNISDTRSGEALMNDGAHTPEGEILGAMGPSAAGNRGDVRRGPSNASSSYSAAGRSDGSGDAGGIGVAYGGGPGHYDQFGSNNPYADGAYGSQQRPSELGGQPVIRDNPARRNTRIESPSHYPQQSAGISQNF